MFLENAYTKSGIWQLLSTRLWHSKRCNIVYEVIYIEYEVICIQHEDICILYEVIYIQYEDIYILYEVICIQDENIYIVDEVFYMVYEVIYILCEYTYIYILYVKIFIFYKIRHQEGLYLSSINFPPPIRHPSATRPPPIRHQEDCTPSSNKPSATCRPTTRRYYAPTFINSLFIFPCFFGKCLTSLMGNMRSSGNLGSPIPYLILFSHPFFYIGSLGWERRRLISGYVCCILKFGFGSDQINFCIWVLSQRFLFRSRVFSFILWFTSKMFEMNFVRFCSISIWQFWDGTDRIDYGYVCFLYEKYFEVLFRDVFDLFPDYGAFSEVRVLKCGYGTDGVDFHITIFYVRFLWSNLDRCNL